MTLMNEQETLAKKQETLAKKQEQFLIKLRKAAFTSALNRFISNNSEPTQRDAGKKISRFLMDYCDCPDFEETQFTIEFCIAQFTDVYVRTVNLLLTAHKEIEQ